MNLPELQDSLPELIGILADRRTGKTSLATYLLYDAHLRGIKVVANYHLNFPFTYMSFADIVKLMSDKAVTERRNELRGAYIGLDELSEGADSYEFWQKPAKQLSKLASQLGKLEARIFYTDQRWNKVAKRLRDQTDIFICLEKTGIKGVATYTVIDRELRVLANGGFDGRSIWHLYDHQEFIS